MAGTPGQTGRLVVAGGLLVALLLLTPKLVEALRLNWANIVVDRAWLAVTYRGPYDDRLQDGLPDGWELSNWGGARASHGVTRGMSHTGSRSVYIEKNNDIDASVYAQTFALPRAEEVRCGVYSRGAAAFVQILAAGITGQNYSGLPASDDWTLTEIRVGSPQSPSAAATLDAMFVLGIGGRAGKAWLDDAYCVASAPDAQNLLKNGGFEEGGIQTDPLEWWRSVGATQHVAPAELEEAYQVLSTAPATAPAQAGRLNAIDLLLGRSDRVAARAKAASAGCMGGGASPEVLLALGPTFQSSGGLAAHERLIQLAAMLMPVCPQPYAQLADLYGSERVYDRAAALYHEAALRALPGRQKGGYEFSEGMMHVTGTGDLGRTIEAMTAAERNSGWQQTSWHEGAPAMYLGNALAQTGRCEEARSAFQRVLDCRGCRVWHVEARAALQALGTCAP